MAKPAAPKTFEELLAEMGAQDIAPVARAIYQQESSGGKADTRKANSSGAIGPMQVTPLAFKDAIRKGYLPKTAKITNPEDSTRAGIAYLMEASKIHRTTDPAILGAYYHGGPRAVQNAQLVAGRMGLSDPLGKTTGAYAEDIVARVAREQGQAAQQAPRTPVNPQAMTHQAPHRPRDEIAMFRQGVESRFAAAMQRGDKAKAKQIRDMAYDYALKQGWVKAPQETENGD